MLDLSTQIRLAKEMGEHDALGAPIDRSLQTAGGGYPIGSGYRVPSSLEHGAWS